MKIVIPEIELLPEDWADNLINKIIWGKEKMLYDKPKVKKDEIHS